MNHGEVLNNVVVREFMETVAVSRIYALLRSCGLFLKEMIEAVARLTACSTQG